MLGVGLAQQLCKSQPLQACRTARNLLTCPARQAGARLQQCSAAATTPQPTEYPHTSVMLNEVLGFFKGCQVEELHTVIGFDQDPSALAIARARLGNLNSPPANIHLVNANYRFGTICAPAVSRPLTTVCLGSELSASLAQLSIPEGSVNGMLMDLGVSSMQIDQADRGFSFMNDGPLDMRMNPASALSAEEVLNTWSEAELARIIRDYGEEKLWKAVARRIVRAREQEGPIRTTQQLVKAIGYTNVSKDKKGGSKQIHPATRTFQAIRIAVNDELQKLEETLPQAIQSLAPGGRLGVISFHGLEDRIVKKAFQRAAGRVENDEPISFYSAPSMADPKATATVKLLSRKPAVPTEAEVQTNPRSRSAKLRFIEKL